MAISLSTHWSRENFFCWSRSKKYNVVLVRMQAKKARAERNAPQVAVIIASGSIVKGKGQAGGLGDGAEVASVPMCRLLGDARKDDNIKAVVLRIDSPGRCILAFGAAVKHARDAPAMPC